MAQHAQRTELGGDAEACEAGVGRAADRRREVGKDLAEEGGHEERERAAHAGRLANTSPSSQEETIRRTPPPRVGNLTGGGLLNPDTTCRYFHHYSFIAPQYKLERDPLAAFVLPSWQNSTRPGASSPRPASK